MKLIEKTPASIRQSPILRRAAHKLARSLGDALLSPRLRYVALAELDLLRSGGPRYLLRFNAMLTTAWVRERISRRRYRVLTEEELRASRKSDTVFVFGSGASLNDITEGEWAYFDEHDVFGFNAFYNQRWLPVGFHLLRGGVYGELRWRAFVEEDSAIIRSNPLYSDTIFLVQGEYLGHLSNQLLGYGFLPAGTRIFRYRSVRENGPPTRSLAEGIRHVGTTLTDVVNAAYCLGWKEIVLVGVDLYDSRYFWLGPNETLAVDPATGKMVPAEINNVRGNRYDEEHNTVRSGIVDLMGQWHGHLEREGVRLRVYNPRSLLARVLPVYESPASP